MVSFLWTRNGSFHWYKMQFLTAPLTEHLNWQFYNERWKLKLDRLFNKHWEELTYARARFHNVVFLISKIYFLSNTQKRKDRKKEVWNWPTFIAKSACYWAKSILSKFLLFLAKRCHFYEFRMIWEKQPLILWPEKFYTSLSNSSRALKLRKLPLWDNFYNLLDLSHFWKW